MPIEPILYLPNRLKQYRLYRAVSTPSAQFSTCEYIITLNVETITFLKTRRRSCYEVVTWAIQYRFVDPTPSVLYYRSFPIRHSPMLTYYCLCLAYRWQTTHVEALRCSVLLPVNNAVMNILLRCIMLR